MIQAIPVYGPSDPTWIQVLTKSAIQVCDSSVWSSVYDLAVRSKYMIPGVRSKCMILSVLSDHRRVCPVIEANCCAGLLKFSVAYERDQTEAGGRSAASNFKKVPKRIFIKLFKIVCKLFDQNCSAESTRFADCSCANGQTSDRNCEIARQVAANYSNSRVAVE